MCLTYIYSVKLRTPSLSTSSDSTQDKAARESRHLLDDSFMGAVVLTKENTTGEFRGVVLIQSIQQGHVQVALPCKLAVHKWTELEIEGGQKEKKKDVVVVKESYGSYKITPKIFHTSPSLFFLFNEVHQSFSVLAKYLNKSFVIGK